MWNFRGELVTSFEDHLLWHPDCNTNNIYITSDQDLIISYCKSEEGCEDEGEGIFSPLIYAVQCCPNRTMFWLFSNLIWWIEVADKIKNYNNYSNFLTTAFALAPLLYFHIVAAAPNRP